MSPTGSMARSRSIKPGFFRDRQLLELSPLTRLLFAGLWTIADREGRLRDDPKQIKLDVIPLDKCNIDKMLEELAQAGFVVRYSFGSGRFIQIRTWDKHQTPHVKEPASTIPAPDLSGAKTSSSFILTPLTYNPLTDAPTEERQKQEHAKNENTFSLKEPWDWFREIWPATIPNTIPAIKTFEKSINNLDRLTHLRQNMPLWVETRRFKEGFFSDWTKFLISDVWMEPPKPAEMGMGNGTRRRSMLDDLEQAEATEKARTQ